MGSPSPSLSCHAFVLAFPFFLLASQLSIGSSEENWFVQHYAPFGSPCGKLINISFPFSNSYSLECGLSIINCVNSTAFINSEDDRDRDRFEVKSINYADTTIVIHDRNFTQLIQQNRCDDLHNFTIPRVSGHLSFQLINAINLTFAICEADPAAYIHDNGLLGVRRCGNYDLHFSTSNSVEPLPDCEVVEFPVDALQPQVPREADGLLHRLSGGFRLRWNPPQQCHQCKEFDEPCQKEGNQGLPCCLGPSPGPVPNHEEYGQKGGKRKNIKIGVSTGVGAILAACVVFFLVYYRRRRKGVPFALPKTRSPSPSLTPLSASIASYPHYAVHLFSYEELEEATNNFNSNQELGDGGFGTVYYGKLRDGREVAVKRLYENNCKRVEQFMNEVEILAHLSHQNLVVLYGCTSRHSRELLLVYEFIPNGTVADHLHGDRAESGSVPWPTRMSIAIETAQALSYLHASEVIHRDVKTNNILLDKNFRVKVADFGLSRLFPTEVTHISTAPQGTPGYVDPEYHQCYSLTAKSDVYSFGVVLIELISSKPAVDITRHWHEINLASLAINKIQNRAVHELVDPCLGYESDVAVRGMITSVAALAFRCLQYERELRPSMEEVLEVLKGIESEDYKNVVDGDGGHRAEVIDIPMEHTPPPIPPDSFTD